MKKALTVPILLSLSAATMPLAFAGGQAGVNNQGNGSVQAAIRYERAKDAADARQSRVQGRANQPFPAQAAASANQAAQAGNVKDPGAQEAIRFERSKDAADARQARIESGQSNAGNADRRVVGHN